MPAPESRWNSKLNIQHFIAGGLIAGLLINAVEYFVYGVMLDQQWTAALAVLGKKPAGWATDIPSNFVAGLFGISVYARFWPHHRPGQKAALRALTIWADFCKPRAAIRPIDLFPYMLLLTTVLMGLVGSVSGVLRGAWIYRPVTQGTAAAT